jgi:hypothetical protein
LASLLASFRLLLNGRWRIKPFVVVSGTGTGSGSTGLSSSFSQPTNKKASKLKRAKYFTIG